jgi:hypothetical protein
MDTNERRLILARCYDRAIETVLDAFLGEGFTLTPIEAGDLHRHAAPAEPWRYAALEATLPELSCCEIGPPTASATLGCRLSFFELAESCTLLTAENPRVRYPPLDPLVSRFNERIGDALRRVMRAGILTAA